MPTIPYDQRSFWIESWDGSMVMPLPLEHYSSEAVALRGMLGLGVNPTDLITEGTPGVPGTRVVDVVHGERPVALPIGVLGDTQEEVWAAVQKLRDITNPGDGMTPDGNFRLVCVSASGSRELLLAYRSGLEGEDSERRWFDRFVIDCVAVMPYAQDRADQTLDFTLAQEFEPFLADSTSEAAFVQSFASTTTTSSATRTATPAATVPVGAVLVAVLASSSSVAASSVSDVSGNTWTLAAAPSPVSGATLYVYKSKITAPIAPGQLVTGTWGFANSANRLYVLEYKGLTGNVHLPSGVSDFTISAGATSGVQRNPEAAVMAVAAATVDSVASNWSTPPAGIGDSGSSGTFTSWQSRVSGLKTAVSDAVVPAGPALAQATWPESPGTNGDLGVVLFEVQDNASGGLALTGVAPGRASTPDASVLDIVGDLDVRVKAALTDWTPTTVQTLISKWNPTGNQQSYVMEVQTSGVVRLAWSPNGTAVEVADSTVAPVVANGATLWVRATLDVDNGAAGKTVTFYTSGDGFAWTQLGAAVVQAGVSSVFASTAELAIGSSSNGTANRMSGTVYAAQVRSGINGAVVANPNFGLQPAGTTAFTDGAGRTWTVVSPATIAAPSGSAGNSWPWGTRKLSPSTVGGMGTPVQLYSSVPVYPIIEITGPADSVLITADNGLRIDVPLGIPGGSTLRIVSDPRNKSIRLDGAPAAGMLARGSRLTPFPEGITLIDVIAPGATEATLLRLTWRGLYRSVW